MKGFDNPHSKKMLAKPKTAPTKKATCPINPAQNTMPKLLMYEAGKLGVFASK
jgi:hypothetical protein